VYDTRMRLLLLAALLVATLSDVAADAATASPPMPTPTVVTTPLPTPAATPPPTSFSDYMDLKSYTLAFWSTVVSVLVLAIYSIQIWYMRQAVLEAKTSALAALTSAEAARKSVDAELSRRRPRILGELGDVTFWRADGQSTGRPWGDFRGRLTYRNWGGAAAWIDAMVYGVVTVPLIKWESGFPQVAPQPETPVSMTAVESGGRELGELLLGSLTEEELQLVASREAEIVVSGAIAYQDPLGTRYVSGFCWILATTGIDKLNRTFTVSRRRGPAHYFFDRLAD